MAMPRRKSTKKVKPKLSPKVNKVSVDLEVPPFHIMFPFTLIYKEDKSTKYCYFQAQEHVKKYIARAKLTPKQYKVIPTEPRTSNNELD